MAMTEQLTTDEKVLINDMSDKELAVHLLFVADGAARVGAHATCAIVTAAIVRLAGPEWINTYLDEQEKLHG